LVESGKQREARLGTIADAANAVRMASADDGNALGRTVFFVGAGCSVSAGIPLVPDMARSLVQRLTRKAGAPDNIVSDSQAAYRWLAAKGQIRDCFAENLAEAKAVDDRAIDWFRVYDAAFSDHFNTPDDAREVFSEFVDDAGGKINWTHLCLGELVRQRLTSTIITTNFDQLVLSGLVRSGVIPVVCDGIESLTRIRGAPHHAQLIELHGSRHTYRLRNATEEVAELANDEPTIAAIGSIFQDMRALIVIGYGGREDGVMDLMTKAARRFPDKRLIWVAHDKDPGRLSDKAKAFLATSRNSRLLVGQDSDSFFLQLLKELEIGSPETIREPLFLASANSTTLAPHDSQSIFEKVNIRQEIERHRSEILAMANALHQYRESRTRAESALVDAREMRLAGKFDDALKILVTVPQEQRSSEIWEEVGRTVLDFTVESSTKSILEAGAEAWTRLLNTGETKMQIVARRCLAIIMRRLGENHGVYTALVQAKAIYEELLERDDLSVAEIERSDLQVSYGIVLGLLGERERSTENFQKAIAVFYEVLKVHTREEAPLDWASAQLSLGNSLLGLGERESGTTKIKEAIVAYREALKEWLRERVPEKWALAQMNLGNALFRLGERESGTATLKEAITAYQEALKERIRERAPLRWALVHSNMGSALVSLGEREIGTATLGMAVDTFRNALSEFNRESTPVQWASAQMNLGTALAISGTREDASGKLEDAIAAFEEAVKVVTRESAPLDWAMIRMNTGNVLTTLGSREGNKVKLELAVAAYREALKVFTIETSPHNHRMAKRNLNSTLKLLRPKAKNE